MAEDFPADERRALLALARRAIAERLHVHGSRASPAEANPRLQERRGAFVTLSRREDGSLRGCVGYIEPLFPLAEAVQKAALAAAFGDDRFPPVRAEELPGLEVHLSVLGRPREIDPEDVEVGRHGLIVEQRGRRGLLLPQVPSEQGWDKKTFLEQTCRKAGLGRDAWREAGTVLLAFEAEVFGEEEGG